MLNSLRDLQAASPNMKFTIAVLFGEKEFVEFVQIVGD